METNIILSTLYQEIDWLESVVYKDLKECLQKLVNSILKNI